MYDWEIAPTTAGSGLIIDGNSYTALDIDSPIELDTSGATPTLQLPNAKGAVDVATDGDVRPSGYSSVEFLADTEPSSMADGDTRVDPS